MWPRTFDTYSPGRWQIPIQGTPAILRALALLAVLAAAALLSSPEPAAATGDIVALSAGEAHTCALTTEGGVICWGRNDSGQLGNGTTTASLTPADVLGLTSGVTAIAAGGNHTCALIEFGVKCWGRNDHGQLGDGTTVDSTAPVQVASQESMFGVSAGANHTCALSSIGGAINLEGFAVQCWGRNDNGQLGDGTTADSTAPVQVASVDSMLGVSAGAGHTCVLTADVISGAKCWGLNNFGQLGDGTTTNSSTPVQIVGLGGLSDIEQFTGINVNGVSAGGNHTCAMTGSGLLCWGRNNYGQLGDGTMTSSSTPVQVMGVDDQPEQFSRVLVTALSTGKAHTCAMKRTLTVDGPLLLDVTGAMCWGRNFDGQVGDGTVSDTTTPVDVLGLTSGVTAISAGGRHTCAIAAGVVKCWGANDQGQLGHGTTDDSSIPLDIGVKPTSTETATPTPTDTPMPTVTGTPPAATPTVIGTPATPAPTATPTELLGDVNCVGGVNTIDATIILQIDAGLISSVICLRNGDVNGDGSINSIDATLILQFDAGLIGSLPSG